MSLILDALNRANTANNLVGPPGEAGPPQRRSLMRLVGIAFIVITIVALNTAIVLYLSSDPAPTSSSEGTTSMPSEISTEISAENPAAFSADPSGRQSESGITRGFGEPPAEPRLLKLRDSDIAIRAPVPIGELPARIRADIPPLALTSHIYASDASLRMVNINNRLLHEGDPITRDVVLQEITPDGVIMRHGEYAFILSVMDVWTSDGK